MITRDDLKGEPTTAAEALAYARRCVRSLVLEEGYTPERAEAEEMRGMCGPKCGGYLLVRGKISVPRLWHEPDQSRKRWQFSFRELANGIGQPQQDSFGF